LTSELCSLKKQNGLRLFFQLYFGPKTASKKLVLLRSQTWARAGGRASPWIFMHGTNIVDRG